MESREKQPLSSFLEYLKYEKQYSEHTLKAYESDLQLFGTHLAEAFQIDVLHRNEDCVHIKAVHIRAWLASLEQERTTVLRKLASVRAWLKFLFRSEIIPSNPAVKIKLQNRKKRLVPFIREQDINELLNQNESETPPFDFARNRVVLELLYGCGLRRSELAGLTDNQILRSEKMLKIKGKGNKQRLIPYNEIVSEALSMYEKECISAGFDFRTESYIKTNKGKPVYGNLIYAIVKYSLSSIPDLSKRHPHLLRHTYATHLVAQGADLHAVKELLGHAGLKSTEVYVHNSVSKLKEIHSKLHPRG